jgi:hypothetical protein
MNIVTCGADRRTQVTVHIIVKLACSPITLFFLLQTFKMVVKKGLQTLRYHKGKNLVGISHKFPNLN